MEHQICCSGVLGPIKVTKQVTKYYSKGRQIIFIFYTALVELYAHADDDFARLGIL